MKKLLIIFITLVVSASVTHAGSVILGNGVIGSTFTQSGMAGLNPGDTILIHRGGPYNASSITGLAGAPNDSVYIMPQDWALGDSIRMQGTLTLNGKYMSVRGISFSNYAGVGLNMTGGHSSNSTIKVIHGFSIQDLIDANSNLAGTYTDTSSYKFYKMKFDSLYSDSTGFILLTSFGAVGDAIPKDIVDSLIVSNVTVRRTKTNGTMVQGIIFRYNFFNWDVKTTFRALNGDVGQFAIAGNGTIHDCFKNGGVGYTGRLIIFTMAVDTSVATPAVLKIWNVGQCNTSDYGVFDIKNDKTEWSTHIKGGSVEAYYTTAYNLGNTINYWSDSYVMGDFYPPYYIKIKYNTAAKETTNGKPGLIFFQGTTAGVTFDTTQNYYSSFANVLQIDTTGQFPTLIPKSTSPLVNKGASLSFVPLDFYKVSRPSTPTAGFAEPTPIGTPCNCIPGRRQNAKVFKLL